jgi:predicted nicotinamide N-methyase
VAFILANTRLCAPSCLPELRMYLASDVTEVWERTEAVFGPDRPPPFWAFAWAGGQALARYVLDHPEVVAGRRVLDIASGGGAAAVAAAVGGAAAVTASDIDRLAVEAIGLNAAANGVVVEARCADLLDDPVGSAADAPTVVLAGDVCYSREMTGRVLRLLDRAGRSGATVLLGDPGRAYLPTDRLTAVASYRVPVPRDLESVEVKHTTVWRPATEG